MTSLAKIVRDGRSVDAWLDGLSSGPRCHGAGSVADFASVATSVFYQLLCEELDTFRVLHNSRGQNPAKIAESVPG